MENKMSGLVETVEKMCQHEVVAVFKRGSRMRGLENEQSDYDFLFLVENNMNDWFSVEKGFNKEYRLELGGMEAEVQVKNFTSFVQLFMKSNATLWEMLRYEPIFLSDYTYQWFFEWVGDNLKKMALVNVDSFVNSMLRQDLANISHGKLNRYHKDLSLFYYHEFLLRKELFGEFVGESVLDYLDEVRAVKEGLAETVSFTENDVNELLGNANEVVLRYVNKAKQMGLGLTSKQRTTFLNDFMEKVLNLHFYD